MNDCGTLGLTALDLFRVTAPTSPVLSLEEARRQLRVTPTFGTSPPTHPEDELIEMCVQAATDELEGVDGWLGRSLTTQTWRLSMARFPSGAAIPLPLPPLQAVTSVSYLDADGVRQVLGDEGASPAGEDYRVVTQARVGYIAPAHGRRWPTGRVQADSVQIEFVAGYGDGSAVPALIRQWIAARLGFYYENRESMISGTIVSDLPSLKHVLEGFRIRGVFW